MRLLIKINSMKYFTGLLFALLIIACKDQPKQTDTPEEVQAAIEESGDIRYPEPLQKVFDAHGGLSQWRSLKNLVYEITKENYSEVHTINLYSRMDRVDTPDYSMGFDGKDVWLKDPESKYEGDPVFYHNLMFYFYAMPFVLADEGIVYSETENLDFEGKSYPGIGIGYQANIGTTPKDQYYIHYDPDTYQMAWLGYTVTYRTGEKSDNVKWIRYDEWLAEQGVILPKSITWYNYEGRTIGEARSTVEFNNVSLSGEAKPGKFFQRPAMAEIVQGKVQ